jgi:hypothetical protein
MIINATDTQILVCIFLVNHKDNNFSVIQNMTRSAPPTNSSGQPSSSQTVGSQNIPGPSMDIQNQMIQKFSQQSGMNIEYSKLLVLIFTSKYLFGIFQL